jgi:hypothetical protein
VDAVEVAEVPYTLPVAELPPPLLLLLLLQLLLPSRPKSDVLREPQLIPIICAEAGGGL